jgi:hypothetical protein
MAKKSFVGQELSRRLKNMRVAVSKLEDFDGKQATSTMELKLDNKAIDRLVAFVDKWPDQSAIALKESLGIIAVDLNASLDDAMDAAVWQWNDDTRDIVDTGELRDSANVYVDGNNIVITYSQEYAAIVHFGGYAKSGFNPEIQIYYPPRPWVEAVLLGGYPVPQFDFVKELSDVFISRLGDMVLKM